MTAWLVICAVGLGTYALRAVTFAIVSERGLPAWAERPLTFVSPAAIGALVGGMLLTAHGSASVPALAEAAAATAAFVTVHRTGNIARGILVGFPVLWGLGWLAG